MMTKWLISIVGPTAIGKTSLSIKIADYYKTEIISADSRQFYKEMKIGTAVPSIEELSEVPHHFIQHISVVDKYTVGDFQRDALLKLKKLFIKHKVVVMVGGSGLYSNAVIEGLDDFPDINPKVRENLIDRLENEGLPLLTEELKKVDPQSYDKIDLRNPHRVIRALEVSLGSGKPYSEYLNRKKVDREFEVIKIGLTADRPLIYQRINDRVEKMIEAGLFMEAEGLMKYKDLNALNTVGYKEIFKYFDGKWNREEAVSEIKKNTRRFAKRQLTWYRKDDGIDWFNAATPITDIIEMVKCKIATHEK